VRALPNLIRLRKWTLDEARRKVGDLVALKGTFEEQLAELDDELSREKEAARASIDSLATLQGYYGHVRQRRSCLARSIVEVETSIEIAREEASEAYRELKKFETALEYHQKRETIEASRRQQIVYDEMAINMHRRKQSA